MCSNEESDFIPAKLFNQIMKLLPIVSVEAVIMINDGLLLLRRKNEPAMGNGGSLAVG
jgi:ADP-ribose pyrophosphatase YjhB (NUDIX family)